jgi:hypothetical protein
MGGAIGLREDFEADELRRLATRAEDAAQARRLLALAAVRDGMNRTEAARIGGMDRQTLRDWVHRFNQHGPDGLIDIKPSGRPPKLSEEQRQASRPAPTRRRTAWCAGAASTSSAFSDSASVSSCQK